MSQVLWSAQALSDLEAIKAYISHDSVNYAERFISKIFLETEKILCFPNSGRIVPEAKLDFIREIYINDYRVVYSIVGENINILTVHHGAKLLGLFEV